MTSRLADSIHLTASAYYAPGKTSVQGSSSNQRLALKASGTSPASAVAGMLDLGLDFGAGVGYDQIKQQARAVTSARPLASPETLPC